MGARRGHRLEKNVARMLELSGFEPQTNVVKEGYEIDVLLYHNGNSVAFECKQYESSSLNVRNLIHEWDSKNKELEFDKIVFVIIGVDFTEEHHELAERYGIELWGEDKWEKLFDKAIEEKDENKERIEQFLDIESGAPSERLEEPVKGELELDKWEKTISYNDLLEISERYSCSLSKELVEENNDESLKKELGRIITLIDSVPIVPEEAEYLGEITEPALQNLQPTPSQPMKEQRGPLFELKENIEEQLSKPKSDAITNLVTSTHKIYSDEKKQANRELSLQFIPYQGDIYLIISIDYLGSGTRYLPVGGGWAICAILRQYLDVGNVQAFPKNIGKEILMTRRFLSWLAII